MEFKHIPVMLNECIEGLAIKADGIYLDGTLGGGGHSLEIVKRLDASKGGRLIAIDRDAEAIEAASKRLNEYADRITLVHDDFKNAVRILEQLHIDKLDGVLLDLGISSYQVDNGERGFSYMQDAPLDMRMDQGQYLTAFNVVNEYPVPKLAKILYEYGDERLSRVIAEKIGKIRETETISTTGQLAKIVENCYPAKTRWKFGNPCKRSFQAIRIEVNGELDGLGEAITALARSLKSGGRMAVITFHSLEDRIAKNCFRELETDCICDKSLPQCVCGKVREIKLITRKPLTATEEELEINSRAESAKLRIIEKL